jgi:hypothetical protein
VSYGAGSLWLKCDKLRIGWPNPFLLVALCIPQLPSVFTLSAIMHCPFRRARPPQVKPAPATRSAIKRAFCSKVAHLLPQTWTDKRGYSEAVRYDTSTPMYDGPAFKSSSYEHSVTAVDFNSTNGDRRVQAAAVINQHPAFLRLRTPAPTT